jgi:transposase
MFDELGIAEVIDRATQQNPETRIVTAGHAVKAMVLNGLGFVNPQLYRVPRFFQDKPLSRLLAPLLIEAKHLHNETRGRALDTLYAGDVTALYSLIAATAAARLGLAAPFAHLDSTSFHVDGRYNSDEEPAAQVVHITQGYSRDHRPDLNQVMLALIIEHQAGIPVLMKPLSGHSSDAPEFGRIVKEHMAQLQTTHGTTYLVADSALYSEANLQQLAKTRIKWMTRVPATLHDAQAMLAQADLQTMAPLTDGYRYHLLSSTDGGVAQRWVLIYSAHRHPQAQHTVGRQLRKQGEQEVQAFQQLCRTTFACEADAQQALATFTKVYRPPSCMRSLCALHHAIGSGDDRARAPYLPRSSTPLKGLLPPPSRPFSHVSTGRVVSCSPPMNSTRPSCPSRSCSLAIKVKHMWNVAFASSRTPAFWPRRCISKSPRGSWPC